MYSTYKCTHLKIFSRIKSYLLINIVPKIKYFICVVKTKFRVLFLFLSRKLIKLINRHKFIKNYSVVYFRKGLLYQVAVFRLLLSSD